MLNFEQLMFCTRLNINESFDQALFNIINLIIIYLSNKISFKKRFIFYIKSKNYFQQKNLKKPNYLNTFFFKCMYKKIFKRSGYCARKMGLNAPLKNEIRITDIF